MSNVKRLSTLPCLILVLLSVLDASQAALSQSPLNHAAAVGETVVLICRVDQPPPASRIMWGEFMTNPGGAVISDNGDILDHVHKDRYRIINSSPTQFDLEIRNVGFHDGGKYVCQDTLAGPPNVFKGEAELIVLDPAPNCTTTQPSNGVIIEGHTHTAECIIHYQGHYAPTMTWSGPPPFKVGNSPPNPTSVWSGVEYVVDRSMDTRAFQCLTNFTEIDQNVPADVASNTPTWSNLYRAGQIFVYWGPKNMYIEPIKAEYAVGDVLTCHADAFPEAYLEWQNMRTLEIFVSKTFTVTEDLVGFNQTMRCQGQNLIDGFIYSANIFTPVDVPAPTSPPTTSTTLPTTTQAEFGPCKDIGGNWVAKDPYAEMILEVVHDSELGEIRGIMKNLTDTVWVEVVGTVRRGDYLYLGLTAIWPFSDGITGMAGECHSCRGTEVILTDSLWRSVAASAKCGEGSTPAPDVSYRFNRVGSSSILREKEFDVMHPTKEVSGKLGIKLRKRR